MSSAAPTRYTLGQARLRRRSSRAPTHSRSGRRSGPSSTARARCTFDAVLADPDVDAIVNLTPPQDARRRRPCRARGGQGGVQREAARHRASTKAPSSSTSRRGRGCASAARPTRSSAPGSRPVARSSTGATSASRSPRTRSCSSPGPERWHPSPAIFYERGAGPLLRHGPVLPHRARAAARARTRGSAAMARITREQREITSEPLGRRDDRRGGADARAQRHRVRLGRHRDARHELRRAGVALPHASRSTAPRRRCRCPTRTPSAAGDRSGVRATTSGPRSTCSTRDLPQHRGIGSPTCCGRSAPAARTARPPSSALHVLELMTRRDRVVRARAGASSSRPRASAPTPLPVGLPAEHLRRLRLSAETLAVRDRRRRVRQRSSTCARARERCAASRSPGSRRARPPARAGRVGAGARARRGAGLRQRARDGAARRRRRDLQPQLPPRRRDGGDRRRGARRRSACKA